jgi:predicted ABC-type ATPase
LKKIPLWQAHGYQVKLWFLSLPNEDIAVSRVARRVQQGGHNIPEDMIRRRFNAGLENLKDHALMKAGHDQSQIAKLLDRHKSSISRELSRNTGCWGYRPKQACEMSAERAQNSQN